MMTDAFPSFGPAETSLRIYRAINPATDCDYPFLAIPSDLSMLLSLGEHGLCFEFVLPPELERWLAEDFARTDERFSLDLTSLRYVLERTYRSGVEFGILHFDEQLHVQSVELSLCSRDVEDEGLEFQVRAFGDYERILRDSTPRAWEAAEEEQRRPVSLSERALLDVCCSTFAPLARLAPQVLSAPLPQRYWQLGRPAAP
jgi:hypothetical protein